MLISVLICILVPLVYAMMMLSPKWGPYDNRDNLPVAVVNSDEGAVKDGENINVGNELVENLKSNEEELGDGNSLRRKKHKEVWIE